jgi:hypothetical protein
VADSEKERRFHKETTVITPGINLKNKKKQDKVGKNKERTTVFQD